MRLRPARRFSWFRVLLGLLALFVLIQLVPYGRAHANPAVQAQPAWKGEQTQALFTRACADCHSHTTKWPWYSNVAPVSWVIQNHVQEGRSHFNVNVPGYGRDAGEAAGQVRSGQMPDGSYPPFHPEARLSAAERETLAQGLAATFGEERGEGGEGR